MDGRLYIGEEVYRRVKRLRLTRQALTTLPFSLHYTVTSNLRLTMRQHCGFAVYWFKRPLSVIKRSDFLRLIGAGCVGLEPMTFDRLTLARFNYSAVRWFKRSLSVIKRLNSLCFA